METYSSKITNHKALTRLLTISLLLLEPVSVVIAAGHRDSPAEVASPATDISGFYLFRSWEKEDRIVVAMNVFPGQTPDDGLVFSGFEKFLFPVSAHSSCSRRYFKLTRHRILGPAF